MDTINALYGASEQRGRTLTATVKLFLYDSHDQLRVHIADIMAAFNFARPLKTLGGLTPYGYICQISTQERDRFTLNRIHQTQGVNA